MARDRSYDRGRAWRAGNEEEGGYGQSGMQGDDAVLHRPRYGRSPDRPSNGGVEYREVERRGGGPGLARDAENPSYRGSGGPYANVGPRGYRRSDASILEDVSERFTQNAYLDASDVEVRVEEGEVTLEGTVENRTARRLAEDIAEATRGVLDVHNRLRVRATGPDPEPAERTTL
jgi:hypothetical protein